MPEGGSDCRALVPIASGDAPCLRDITKLLNAVLSGVAATNGATCVDTYADGIGHDVCQFPGVKWMEGVSPQGPLPAHPMRWGHGTRPGRRWRQWAAEWSVTGPGRATRAATRTGMSTLDFR